MTPSLPKLNAAARERIQEAIEAERAVGDRKVAATIEMLLLLHDKVHGITDR
ncbi:hypothetical protein [Mesorhizobium sp.]|uniref:hypothetical protein n=1 Tax=Mesorhizobium sp. TaxID=1871066 RepID=UPI0025C71102|nr:hypothetical protein [Mesorhizobium sp.]